VKIYVSQGSDAVKVWWYVLTTLFYKFSTKCASEKSLKYGHYLARIWAKVCGLLFWATLYRV